MKSIPDEAAQRIALIARSADGHFGGSAGYQLVPRRIGPGVRSDAGERYPHLRSEVRQSFSLRRGGLSHGRHGPATVENWVRQLSIVVSHEPRIPLARLAKTKRPVHVADLRAEPAYKAGFAPLVTLVDNGGARTLVIVPMLKERALVGAIAMCRQEVRPFTDKQIALVTNFAAQAVIAIENTRLLNELRQRTADLTESLEQQTATSKVLDVISRSAFDLHAVFEAVVESSVGLCGAERGLIHRFDDEMLRIASSYNTSPQILEWIAQHPIRPGTDNAAARAALERGTIHIPDVQADPDYTYGAKDIRVVLHSANNSTARSASRPACRNAHREGRLSVSPTRRQ
jgi:GAF domain-containing protein